MTTCLRIPNARREELKAFLAKDAHFNLFALGLLEDHGLAPEEGAPLQAFALEDGAGAFQSVLVSGGGGGMLLPCAPHPEAAEALGRALAGRLPVRTLMGPRLILDAFLRGIDAENRVLLIKPLRFFAASADDLGPFVCPELHKATTDDLPQLIPLAAAAIEETLGENPLACAREAFERRVATRALMGRTYVLAKDGQLVFKLDVTARSRFGLEIEGIYTRPDFRRRGVATLALGQITRHMLGSMPLLVVRTNEDDAIAASLCQRVGYLPVRRQGQQRAIILS
ncbi:MAG: GNAT family N-acetyltransferase [Myxococcales bacterium]|jgi:GNAT superfamily N-acetyltransferase|nr:GNAT family N-acetyltransferase [Myxococcales bacterium]